MAERFNLDAYVRKVPNFPKKGVRFYDISSILAEPKAFGYCIDSMMETYKNEQIDAVAGIEARGFFFASPFADRMGLPLIPVRKAGKLPGAVLSESYGLEYGKDTVEIQPDYVPRGGNVFIVDDIIATGGTIKAAEYLIKRAGGNVVGAFGVIGLPFLGYERALAGMSIHTLREYHSE